MRFQRTALLPAGWIHPPSLHLLPVSVRSTGDGGEVQPWKLCFVPRGSSLWSARSGIARESLLVPTPRGFEVGIASYGPFALVYTDHTREVHVCFFSHRALTDARSADPAGVLPAGYSETPCTDTPHTSVPAPVPTLMGR